MFTVYVLKSLKNGKRYVGYTGKTALERLREHNSGSTPFTKHNGPYILVYAEQITMKSEAIRREHFLKSGKGRELLDAITGPLA